MRALLLMGALALLACDASGTQPATGLEATLRVAGGTYFPGALPEGADGPAVVEVNSNNNNVFAGEVGKRVTGKLAPGGNALALALENDTGYWILPAGVPDSIDPMDLTYDARLSFSRELTPGMHTLTLRAADSSGHFGAPSTLALTVREAAAHTLNVKLTWDSEADLDLHVQLPGDKGVIVWANNVNSYQAPPPPDMPDPTQIAAGGVLDYDSNSQCAIDGRREENVFWTQAPPSGTYQARVDAFSMCGQPAAHWTMEVTMGDQVLGSAQGTLGEEATRSAHDAAAGLLAVTFTVP